MRERIYPKNERVDLCGKVGRTKDKKWLEGREGQGRYMGWERVAGGKKYPGPERRTGGKVDVGAITMNMSEAQGKRG